ncbi:hypothetical protein AMECASPLE_018096 [Ameca splendens]|uniref:Uncharacterized protein n=1 Tax=Ameca splendens TaxID=208324 RepID=A0ABV0YDW6_9TELE
MGHSRVEESPAPLEEMGSRAHAVCGGGGPTGGWPRVSPLGLPRPGPARSNPATRRSPTGPDSRPGSWVGPRLRRTGRRHVSRLCSPQRLSEDPPHPETLLNSPGQTGAACLLCDKPSTFQSIFNKLYGLQVTFLSFSSGPQASSLDLTTSGLHSRDLIGSDKSEVGQAYESCPFTVMLQRSQGLSHIAG